MITNDKSTNPMTNQQMNGFLSLKTDLGIISFVSHAIGQSTKYNYEQSSCEQCIAQSPFEDRAGTRPVAKVEELPVFLRPRDCVTQPTPWTKITDRRASGLFRVHRCRVWVATDM